MNKFVVKHTDCDLYIAEQAGSWARWGSRQEAIEKTQDEWDAVLSPNIRYLLEFVPS